MAGIGILSGGIGYLISTFRKGSAEQKSDVISSSEQLSSFWKEQADGYKLMMAEKDRVYTDKLEKLTVEVGQIRGQLIEKEKQSAIYLEILQNRDPETKKFMELMIQAVKDQAESHSGIMKTLSEVHTMASMQHERDFKVTATVSKQ